MHILVKVFCSSEEEVGVKLVVNSQQSDYLYIKVSIRANA